MFPKRKVNLSESTCLSNVGKKINDDEKIHNVAQTARHLDDEQPAFAQKFPAVKKSPKPFFFNLRLVEIVLEKKRILVAQMKRQAKTLHVNME